MDGELRERVQTLQAVRRRGKADASAVDEVKALCERLRRIVRESKAVLQRGSLSQNEELKRLRNSIAVMRERGLEIPEALTSEEQSLAQAVAEQDQASQALQVTQIRLLEVLAEIDPDFSTPRQRPKRRKAHRQPAQTSQLSLPV